MVATAWVFDIGFRPARKLWQSTTCAQLRGSVQVLGPGNTVEMVSAFASLGKDPGQALLAAATEHMLELVPQASSQQVISFVSACTSLGFCPGSAFMSVAAAHLHNGMSAAGWSEVAVFLSTCASVAFRPSYTFFAAAAHRLSQASVLACARPSDLADLFWKAPATLPSRARRPRLPPCSLQTPSTRYARADCARRIAVSQTWQQLGLLLAYLPPSDQSSCMRWHFPWHPDDAPVNELVCPSFVIPTAPTTGWNVRVKLHS